jgi:hypothetical protein
VFGDKLLLADGSSASSFTDCLWPELDIRYTVKLILEQECQKHGISNPRDQSKQRKSISDSVKNLPKHLTTLDLVFERPELSLKSCRACFVRLKNGLVYIDNQPFDIFDMLSKFNEMHTRILIHHKLEHISKKRVVSLPIYQEVLRVFSDIDSALSQ